MILGFGKHKGKDICNVPRKDLRYYLSFPDLDPKLRKEIDELEAHWNDISRKPLEYPEPKVRTYFKPKPNPVAKPKRAPRRAKSKAVINAPVVMPECNIQDLTSSSGIDRRNSTHEEGDPF
jgi:hypothetical protein